MQALSNALSNPLIVAILVLSAAYGGNHLWKAVKILKRERDERAEAANTAINHLAGTILQAKAVLTELMESWESRMQAVEQLLKDAALNSEKLLAGSLKACEAIATETAQHRASVEAFSKNLFGQEANDRGREALEIPSDRDKDKHFREMEHRAAGATDSEARDLAEQDLAHTESIYPSS